MKMKMNKTKKTINLKKLLKKPKPQKKPDNKAKISEEKRKR